MTLLYNRPPRLPKSKAMDVAKRPLSSIIRRGTVNPKNLIYSAQNLKVLLAMHRNETFVPYIQYERQKMRFMKDYLAPQRFLSPSDHRP